MCHQLLVEGEEEKKKSLLGQLPKFWNTMVTGEVVN